MRLASGFAVFLVIALTAMTMASTAWGQSDSAPPATFEVTGVARDDVLNVRAAPTARSAIVTKLAPDAVGITLTGRERRNGKSVWREIVHKRAKGWVNARFLKQSIAKRGTPATQSPKVAASSNAAEPKRKRVALVVANGRYRGSMRPLANAPNDGKDMAAALQRVGFDVIVLIDSDVEQSKRALATFAKRAKGAEIALLFYAGHGIQVNGENYLVPVSADPKQPEDLLLQAVSLSQIMDAFKAAAPALSIIILDACRNNPATEILSENARSRGMDGIVIRKGLARRSGLPGMMVVYSTDPDNVASDGIGRNSPFTRSLLEKMTEPEVEVRLMFGAVRDAVVKATKGRQTPWVEEAVLGRFFFKPPPLIRKAAFHGRWQHEHWVLLIDEKSARFERPPYQGVKSETLSKADCGDIFERTYALIQVDRIRAELGNAEIEKWARQMTKAKSMRLMKIVCAYGTNQYYFVLADNRQMLVARYSEQDWVMLEGVYQNPK